MNLIKWGLRQPNGKPDSSNIVKFYEDCANGILWQDDSMIVDHKIRKFYSFNPRVEIKVQAMKNPQRTQIVEKVLSIFSPSDIKNLVDEMHKIPDMLWAHDIDIEVFLKDEVNERNRQKLHDEIAAILLRLSIQYAEKFSKIRKSAINQIKDNAENE